LRNTSTAIAIQLTGAIRYKIENSIDEKSVLIKRLNRVLEAKLRANGIEPRSGLYVRLCPSVNPQPAFVAAAPC